jgi:uncharacterized UPF0160 family protein
MISLNKSISETRISLLADSDANRKIESIVVTHDGRFHIDETLALVVLAGVMAQGGYLRVIRSRAPAESFSSTAIFVDVGFKYDGFRHFDHHQSDFDLVGPAGTKRSSAGLIWMHFGREYLQKITGLKDVVLLHDMIDRFFIQSIDQTDNFGVTDRGHIASIFSDMQVEGKIDEEFMRSFSWIKKVLHQRIIKYAQIVDEMPPLSAITFGSVVTTVPGSMHPVNMDLFVARYPTKYLLWQDKDQTWTLRSTAAENNLTIGRGTQGEHGCIFIHASGFMAKATTKAALMDLIQDDTPDFLTDELCINDVFTFVQIPDQYHEYHDHCMDLKRELCPNCDSIDHRHGLSCGSAFHLDRCGVSCLNCVDCDHDALRSVFEKVHREMYDMEYPAEDPEATREICCSMPEFSTAWGPYAPDSFELGACCIRTICDRRVLDCAKKLLLEIKSVPKEYARFLELKVVGDRDTRDREVRIVFNELEFRKWEIRCLERKMGKLSVK